MLLFVLQCVISLLPKGHVLVICHGTSSMLPPNDVKGSFMEVAREMVTTLKLFRAVRTSASVSRCRNFTIKFPFASFLKDGYA